MTDLLSNLDKLSQSNKEKAAKHNITLCSSKLSSSSGTDCKDQSKPIKGTTGQLDARNNKNLNQKSSLKTLLSRHTSKQLIKEITKNELEEYKSQSVKVGKASVIAEKAANKTESTIPLCSIDKAELPKSAAENSTQLQSKVPNAPKKNTEHQRSQADSASNSSGNNSGNNPLAALLTSNNNIMCASLPMSQLFASPSQLFSSVSQQNSQIQTSLDTLVNLNTNVNINSGFGSQMIQTCLAGNINNGNLNANTSTQSQIFNMMQTSTQFGDSQLTLDKRYENSVKEINMGLQSQLLNGFVDDESSEEVMEQTKMKVIKTI